ncbi:MAG: 3-hydroxybutyryl-CoA dehydrogenase [Flavobacteriaceae bacterium]|nr:3-hydroxybutyryl-CoA dehydrogenase [Flavobacteriaceae bacterium]
MKTVGVIGSGTMGSGIAQQAAMSGCQVLLYDAEQEALTRSKQNLNRILDRLIVKERIDDNEKSRIQNNIRYVNALRDLRPSDLVIEAIVEDLVIKKEVFSKVETIVDTKTILASNTSSLSITAIASSLKQADRCLGIHFFNPVPLMKLVEVIPAVQTDPEILEKTVSFIKTWNKTVAVAKDTPGFIVNRVARPFYGESLRIYEEGLADFHEIDESLKTLGGFRMGPFELMDFIGNDVNYAVTESVFKAFYYDSRYKPSFTQKRLMEAGYLGRKTGRGYYRYDDSANRIKEKSHNAVKPEKAKAIFDRIIAMLINEAADAVYLNIATATDVDLAMTKGVNYPKGLLTWADEIGIDQCVQMIDNLYDEYHDDRYRCSPLLRRMSREGKTFY